MPDGYLFVGEVEFSAELGLVLSAQVGVLLEGPLQAVDLLRREGRAGPPGLRGGRRQEAPAVGESHRGGGGGGGEGATSFALVSRGLLLCAAAETCLRFRHWKKEREELLYTIICTTPSLINLGFHHFYLLIHSLICDLPLAGREFNFDFRNVKISRSNSSV